MESQKSDRSKQSLDSRVEKFLRDVYQFNSIQEIKVLDSYDDFNLQFVGSIAPQQGKKNQERKSQRYVLKVSQAFQNLQSQVELEVMTMVNLCRSAHRFFMVPQIIESVNQKYLETIQLQYSGAPKAFEKPQTCRLMSFIEGQNLTDLAEECLTHQNSSIHSEQLQDPSSLAKDSLEYNLGRSIAELHQCIRQVTADLQSKYQLKDGLYLNLPKAQTIWNLEHFLRVEGMFEKSKQYLDDHLCQVIRAVFQHFKDSQVFEKLSKTSKRTLAHNDLGGENIILTEKSEGCELQFGFIDFGDVMFTYQFCDLAIVLGRYPVCYESQKYPNSNSTLKSDYYLSSLAEILAGYLQCSKATMDQAEKQVLLLLAYARVVTSCVNSKYQNYVTNSGKDPSSYIEMGFTQSSAILRTLCTPSDFTSQIEGPEGQLKQFKEFYRKQNAELWEKVSQLLNKTDNP